MMQTIARIAVISLFAAIVTTNAQAGSAYQDALKNGADQLTSEELAERLTGKTVTFVAAGSGDQYLVYYGENNEAASRKVGDDKSATGFHAFTDRNQICIGWEGRDLPRLRCVDVLLIDGTLHKFKADGSLSGHITELTDGDMT